MSYIVARMQKMKSGNLVGIGNHNQRKTEKHSNKDIDVERSHLNYDLVEGRTQNYKTDIQQFINEKKSSSRAVRKDAVLVSEWIISSDKKFFEDKDDKETERFFKESKDYFADKFGDENIRYAHVHLDETTPHMHLGVVPFDKDQKLSAKRVFNRTSLIKIQDELPALLQERGFDIQRGEKGSERKNLTVPEYKNMKEELKEIDKSLDQKADELAHLIKNKAHIDVDSLNVRHQTKKVEVPTGETNFLGKEKMEIKKQRTGNLIIPEKKFDELINHVNDTLTAKQQIKDYLETDLVQENKELVQENTDYRMDYQTLERENYDLKNQVKSLKQQVQSFKNEIGAVYRTVKDALKRITGDSRTVKDVLKGITQEITKEAPEAEFSRLNKRENKKQRSQGPSL